MPWSISIVPMSIQAFGPFRSFSLQRSRLMQRVSSTKASCVPEHSTDLPLCLVCMGKTQTKAIVALVLQIIAIVVLLVVMGFLIAFMATNFTLCLGFQCSQNTTTFAANLNDTYLAMSSYSYTILKRAFIVSELVCSFVFVVFAVMYIGLFIQCMKKLPDIRPIARATTEATTRRKSRQSRVTTTHVSSISDMSQIPSPTSNRTKTNPSAPNSPYYRAQKICPNCQYVSPYIPEKNVVECPSCHYQSPYVEHAQQW